jgi:hypothetical protein
VSNCNNFLSYFGWGWRLKGLCFLNQSFKGGLYADGKQKTGGKNYHGATGTPQYNHEQVVSNLRWGSSERILLVDVTKTSHLRGVRETGKSAKNSLTALIKPMLELFTGQHGEGAASEFRLPLEIKKCFKICSRSSSDNP